MLKEQEVAEWIGLNSILDPVAGSCEYGNELSGSVKDG
jgi:hypothetical protein